MLFDKIMEWKAYKIDLEFQPVINVYIIQYKNLYRHPFPLHSENTEGERERENVSKKTKYNKPNFWQRKLMKMLSMSNNRYF